MLYKHTLSVIALSSLALSILQTGTAWAQIDIPSGTERRPNLSMDPFERAREAVKSLPGSTPSTPKPSAPKQEKTPTSTTTSDAVSVEDEPTDAFSYGAVAVADVMNVVSGGIPDPGEPDPVPPTTAYPALLTVSGEIDTGAAGLWNDGTFVVQIVGYGGTSPGDLVGDFHGLSSIDSGNDPFFRLYEAWYQHSFDYGKSSFTVGIQDWNSDFYIAEYANLFINGTPGMGAAVNASAGVTTFPATTVGLRYHSALTEDSYFMLGIYDGAGDEEGFFEVSVNQDDGIFASTEVGMTNKEPGEDGYFKAAIGGWFLGTSIESYTGVEEGDEFDDGLGTTTPVNPGTFDAASGTYGAYFLGEMAIGDNIGVFFKAGWADPSYNRYSQFYSGGLNYSGLIPDRVDDVLGIAVIHTKLGQFFLDDNVDSAGEYLGFTAETTFEVTYSAQINDWLVIQPDLQFIQYPAMSFAIPNSTVVGVRVQAEF